jgi:hypothetical protein
MINNQLMMSDYWRISDVREVRDGGTHGIALKAARRRLCAKPSFGIDLLAEHFHDAGLNDCFVRGI